MSWGHVDADLVRLRDGLLDDGDVRRVQDHLANCARCGELDEAISFSRSALETLSSVEAREVDRERIRALLSRAQSGGKPPHSKALRAVAAALIVIAGFAWWYRPRVRFVPAPMRSRSIESPSVANVQKVDSIEDARRIIKAHVGVMPNLKPASPQRILLGTATGAIGSAPASTLFYQIDAQLVRLVVARADALPDPPPSLFGSKRLEMRHDGDARIFTWSASGDAYSLRVPKDIPVAHACGICHEGTAVMPLIERSTRGM